MNNENLELTLQSMSDNLDRCAYPELKWEIAYYGPLIYESSNATAIEEFERIRTKAQVGIDFEKVNGDWSLLKHDHPVTVKLREYGFYKNLSFGAT